MDTNNDNNDDDDDDDDDVSDDDNNYKYSRLPITRTFKGNRKRFELSGRARKKIAGSKQKTVFTAQWTF